MFKLLSLAVVVAFGFTAHADTVINTFDTGPGGVPISTSGALAFGGATTLDALGVTFSFSVTGGATYGDTIGTSGLDLGADFSDPVLDGVSSGVLTLNFDQPTTFVSFDVLLAFPTGPAGNSGGQVTIGSGSPTDFATTGNEGLGGLFSIDTSGFSSGTLPAFSTATISFTPDSSSVMFVIDNLSYSVPSGVPEPASVSLFLGAALVLAGWGSRKARANKQR